MRSRTAPARAPPDAARYGSSHAPPPGTCGAASSRRAGCRWPQSAAAERAHDLQFGARGNRAVEVLLALAADEQDDVTPHAPLLVDHAEPKARKLAIEIDEHRVE